MQEKSKRLENDRIATLESYEILDTPPEASFDRITRLAQIALQTPIVLVSLVDEHRQWFKSSQGLDVSETDRAISFCTHAIEMDEPLIVRNSLEDSRFCDNPLVTGEPHIRFYLGVPLRAPNGHNLGTLCAIDSEPRDPSDTHIAVMQDLARLVIDELELRRMATTDSLTGAMTRRAFDAESVKEVARARRYKHELSCVMFDIDHFKSINDRYGHAAGDLVIQMFVKISQQTMRPSDFIGRLGGEEFAVMLPETNLDGALIFAERLRGAFSESEIEYSSRIISATASLGVAHLTEADSGPHEMLERADTALYEAKRRGRNQTVSDLDSTESKANKQESTNAL